VCAVSEITSRVERDRLITEGREKMREAAGELGEAIEPVEMYRVFIEVRKYRDRDKPGKRPKQVWGSGLRDVRFTRAALDVGVVDYKLDVSAIIEEMEEGRE